MLFIYFLLGWGGGGGGGGGVSAELFTWPYPLTVQARPPRDQRLAIQSFIHIYIYSSSGVRAFAHGAMSRRIDPSWSGPIELFLAPASAPRLV